ncbi:hypothetical protein DIZ76_012255 [Coccidioides immitis]|nr:hypothetical protein DIZ76_012255 [Coccidioides immitis]
MMSTVERGSTLLSRSSSMTSTISVKRELTPQSSVSDPALHHIHDRLDQLDCKVRELHSTVLTKNGYVDRRNKEDESILREFDAQRSLTSKIEHAVGKTKTDVNQIRIDASHLRTEILQLRTHVDELGSNDALLHSNVSRVQNAVNQLQLDVQRLHTNVCTTGADVCQVQAIVSQLRTRMNHTERVRFNSLAHTVHAPITPVPFVEEDGTVRWPEFFPRTVWKFWCLKRRNRVHRLVELAEFYQLEGYQYWGRMPHPHGSIFPGDGYLSDSSDSSDLPSDLTRAEAARLYPEACHQALAATLGLVYYKIRNEVGEGPNQHIITTTHKRAHDEIGSIASGKPKPAKLSRRSNEISPAALHKIVPPGSAVDTKSIVSEGLDKLGWNAYGSQVSDEAMNKLKDIVTDEVNSLLLQALERGRIKIQPSRMERNQASPTGSAKLSALSRSPGADGAASSGDEDMRTVATEIISPVSDSEDGRWAKE